MDNLTVTKAGSTWTHNGYYSWPKTGSVHFFGLATYGISSNLPLGVSNWTVPANQVKGYPKFSCEIQNNIGDIKDLFATKSVNRNNNNTDQNGKVDLEFKHILAKVNFKVTNNVVIDPLAYEITNPKVTITKIEVRNIVKKGDYSFDECEGSWANFNGTSSVVYWSNDTGVVVENGDSTNDFKNNLYIIPSKGVRVEVSYYIIKYLPLTMTIDLPALNIGDNKVFNLELTEWRLW